MSPPTVTVSVYRYLRPLMVLCLITGQFPVINVLADSSDQLRFKYWSLPFVTSCLLDVTALSYFLTNLFDVERLSHTEVMVCLHLMFQMLISHLIKRNSKLIIESLSEIDKLRQLFSLMSSCVSHNSSNPTKFSQISVLLFLCHPVTLMTSVFLLTPKISVLMSIELFFKLFYFGFFGFRMVTAVSLIFYTTSLVVEDLIWVWNCHVSGFLKNHNSLKEYCRLLEKQSMIINKIIALLNNYLVFLFAWFIEQLLCTVFFDSFYDEAEVLNIYKSIHFVVFFWLLILTSSLLSSKFQELSSEAFITELDRQTLSKRDAARMKTVLVQLENDPGQVNIEGFGSITPTACLWFLSLAIECLIVLWQNKLVIREFFTQQLDL